MYRTVSYSKLKFLSAACLVCCRKDKSASAGVSVWTSDECRRYDGSRPQGTSGRCNFAVLSLPRQSADDRAQQVFRSTTVSAERARVRRVERTVPRRQRRQLQSQLWQVFRYKSSLRN